MWQWNDALLYWNRQVWLNTQKGKNFFPYSVLKVLTWRASLQGKDRDIITSSIGYLETLHISFWTDTYCFPPRVQLILVWASPQAKRSAMCECECMSSLELTDSCSQLTRASHKTLVTSCWWDHYKMAGLVMTHISIIASEGVNEAALEWEQAAQANSCIIDINRAARIRGSARNTEIL